MNQLNQPADVAIIIPSYNEAENLKLLLKKIFSTLSHAEVVIVDDSAPAENARLKSLLPKNNNQTLLLTRGKKLGRGSAVIAGLRAALKNPKIEYFIEMDADLAHDPYECQKLLAVASNADLVVGSRYLPGSNIIKWPRYRLILSRAINAFLNLWLGLKLTDYTNGFRLYRRPAVAFLLSEKLRQPGFIALSEIAYKLKRAGFRITEVPTTFTDRKYGKSNATLGELWRSLLGVISIRLARA